jgi:tetratricopeptide (TPR) repeat protein
VVGRVSNTISGGSLGSVVQAGVVYGGIHYHLPPAAPTALRQLPPRPAGFTGRVQELAALATMLAPGSADDTGLVCAIAGLAGVGKTALAIEAAHAAVAAGWFPGGVMFVDLHGYDTPVGAAQALDSLLRALGIPGERLPDTMDDRTGLYRSVLAEQAGAVLVVADNASSAGQVRPLLPADGRHRMLITSRHTLPQLGARLFDLNLPSTDEAVALLDGALRAADPQDGRVADDPAAAGEVVGRSGCLPLAVQVAGALLAVDRTMQVADLARQLAIGGQRLALLDDGERAVRSTFDLSYQRLPDPEARLFGLLALNPGPDVSIAAACVLVQLDEAAVRAMLRDLVHAHLLEPTSVRDRWRMHDLVREYAGTVFPETGTGEAVDRLLDYYMRTTRAADRHLEALPGMLVPEEFTDRAAALLWLDAERANLVAAASLAAATGRDVVARDLPNRLSNYLDWRRYLDDKVLTEGISRDAARRLRDRRGEANALNNLGVALVGLRRFDEAIVACTESAALQKKVRNRRGRGIALNTLGIALRHERRFEEAINAHQQASRLFRRIRDSHSVGMALNNLGSDLTEARRFEEAIAAHTRAVVTYQQIGDRRREAKALGNLGRALREVRRLTEAIAIDEAAASLNREIGDLRGEGDALINLGLALIDTERCAEAIVALENATRIFREVGDPHHEALARTNLGLAFGEVGRLGEGITAVEAAVAILRQTTDRHGEASAMNNLGVVLRRARRFDEAVAAHQQAVAICRGTQDRHLEGAVVASLGLTLHEAGLLEEAIAAHESALAIFRETGDRDAEARTRTNLTALRSAS